MWECGGKGVLMNCWWECKLENSMEVSWASQVALAVKGLPANAGDFRDAGLIPGPGRSPGGGHSNPLLYACRENPMDRGA